MPQVLEAFHEKEYSLFLSQVGFIHPTQMKILFSDQPGLYANKPVLQSIFLAGQAKIACLEGNFHVAITLLDKSFRESSKLFKQNDERLMRSVLAYVHFEYGVFYKMLRSPEQSAVHFLQALNLNPSNKLKLMINFYLELHALEHDGKNSLNRLRQFVHNFEKHNLSVMHVTALYWLGNFSRYQRKFADAKRYYQEGLHFAEKNNLLYMVWNIKNSYGLLIGKKKPQEAVDFFEGFLDSVESHYLKAITFNNLALEYRAVGREDEAIELAKVGLEYSKNHGVISTIPTFGGLIGQLIETYSDSPQEAYHYYKIGYDESMSLQQAGVPLTGARLFAVQKYVEYISKYIPEEIEKISTTHYFKWTAGRSWVNIQDLFHYNLFAYHYVHTGIGDPTFKHLEFNQNSFQTMKKRMRDMRGIHFPNFKRGESDFNAEYFIDSMQQYIAIHKDMTYKQVREQFEKDVFEYLYKHSGYNKVNLAKSLDVAYGTIIRKTKPLTDSVENIKTTNLLSPR